MGEIHILREIQSLDGPDCSCILVMASHGQEGGNCTFCPQLIDLPPLFTSHEFLECYQNYQCHYNRTRDMYLSCFKLSFQSPTRKQLNTSFMEGNRGLEVVGNRKKAVHNTV